MQVEIDLTVLSEGFWWTKNLSSMKIKQEITGISDGGPHQVPPFKTILTGSKVEISGGDKKGIITITLYFRDLDFLKLKDPRDPLIWKTIKINKFQGQTIEITEIKIVTSHTLEEYAKLAEFFGSLQFGAK